MGRYFEIATRQRLPSRKDASTEVRTPDNAGKSRAENNASLSEDALTKETKKTKEAEPASAETNELDASMRRLEAANIRLALWEDGRHQFIRDKNEMSQSIQSGATLYTPRDMYNYLSLEPHERRLLHEFKRKYG